MYDTGAIISFEGLTPSRSSIHTSFIGILIPFAMDAFNKNCLWIPSSAHVSMKEGGGTSLECIMGALVFPQDSVNVQSQNYCSTVPLSIRDANYPYSNFLLRREVIRSILAPLGPKASNSVAPPTGCLEADIDVDLVIPAKELDSASVLDAYDHGKTYPIDDLPLRLVDVKLAEVS